MFVWYGKILREYEGKAVIPLFPNAPKILESNCKIGKSKSKDEELGLKY
jgi:hypothetical protein